MAFGEQSLEVRPGKNILQTHSEVCSRLSSGERGSVRRLDGDHRQERRNRASRHKAKGGT